MELKTNQLDIVADLRDSLLADNSANYKKNVLDDFVKKSSIIYYSREALEPIHKDIIKFATSEQLTAHANSIKVRFEK